MVESRIALRSGFPLCAIDDSTAKAENQSQLDADEQLFSPLFFCDLRVPSVPLCGEKDLIAVEPLTVKLGSMHGHKSLKKPIFRLTVTLVQLLRPHRQVPREYDRWGTRGTATVLSGLRL